MQEVLDALVRHGYLLVGAVVLVNQLGLPIPAEPVLVGAGALVGLGHLDPGATVLVAVLATLAADLLWFEAGRRHGARVMALLCRVSLEPDSCVRRAEVSFERFGPLLLVGAKFLPLVGTVAPPLAGHARLRLRTFLLFDGLGSLVWVLAFCGVGWLFSGAIEAVAEILATLGGWLVLLAVVGLAAYVGAKYLQRRRFLRSLAVARIAPEEVMRMLDAGEAVVIVDLRHSIDAEREPAGLPRALRMTPEEIERRHGEIPRDRDVILYCS
jgi:membrane protein DedA with SNARE-associated domain